MLNPAQRILAAIGVSSAMFNNVPDKGKLKGRAARRQARKTARASRRANLRRTK